MGLLKSSGVNDISALQSLVAASVRVGVEVLDGMEMDDLMAVLCKNYPYEGESCGGWVVSVSV